MSRFHSLALSGDYLESLAEQYRSDPARLPAEWRAAFELFDSYFPGAVAGTGGALEGVALVRRHAHLAARLDPLQRDPPPRWNRLRTEYERRLAALGAQPRSPLVARLLDVYGGSLAVETGHIDAPDRVEWIHAQRENAAIPDRDTRRRALAALIRGETFERFMAQRFRGKKRFGAEGAEAIHPLLQRIFDRAAAAGIEEVVIGTMHRGRLGLMAAIYDQPLDQLFCGMKGQYPFGEPGCAADVPYHMGLVSEYRAPQGTLRIRVLPNPSHLEAVNGVALGYARYRQELLGSPGRVLPLVLHTDASVVAQGVVSETMQLSEVAGHSVGGALNVVINNQVGFTTEPDDGRTSRHCTAAWKAVDSLIAHVNGDDIDAVLMAADLAFDYRQQFGGEAVIDLVCLRANGHNEVDEPRFTQPLYYELAAGRPAISAPFRDMLCAADVVDASFAGAVADGYRAELEAAYSIAVAPLAVDASEPVAAFRTAAPPEQIAVLAGRVPGDGTFNPKAARLVAQRLEEWRTEVSWATAEILALGTVLSMGWDARLTGQDAERGAFSQRHLALTDTSTGAGRRVFETRPDGWGKLEVFNTPLCEYAAQAFEYGYSVAARRVLTIWEAQFGDFSNVAQVVFDQFIASGMEKWGQSSGLVVLLPHGLEGQGPEHSSGRMERVVQLAARGNMRIAHPSTPANYFHLLVSQLHESPRRPLVVFTPKKLLRLKAATSAPGEFGPGVTFQRIIERRAAGRAKRMVVCSGKIYYDVLATLAESGRNDVAIVRLEQIYPFPAAEVTEALRAAPGCEIVWLQEEPRNFGLWTWLREHLEAAVSAAGCGHGALSRVARAESASPAGSFHSSHDADQAKLVAAALGLG